LTFGHSTWDRRLGWIELPDLDTTATSRAVHMLQEATERCGLLGDAVKQMVQTWQDAPRKLKKLTWFGNLRRHLDEVWPEGWSLDWSQPVAFRAAGVSATRTPTMHLGKIFAQRRWQRRWRDRQEILVRRRPGRSTQDYFLSRVIRARGPRADFLNSNVQDSDDERDFDWQYIYDSLSKEVIFPKTPNVPGTVFKKLISTLAGKEDFARVTAHHLRRARFPELEDEDKKRCCLYCYKTHHTITLDSEWHSFFACPLTFRPRERFFLTETQSPDTHAHRHTHEVPDPLSLLVKLVLQCPTNPSLLEALAYLAQDVFQTRRRYFDKLQ
jgi:hypothetical protein